MLSSENLNKCPNCGGIFPLNSFVCEWCGYVETEKVKKVSESKITEISFDESLNIIQDNLYALHNLNKPNVKNGVLKVLRIIVAIHTMGIALIFWKKPKKLFDKKSYNNLKTIIQRNISFLKISSAGSEDLLRRIAVVESELHSTDDEIKKNLRAKQITVALIIGAYIMLFVINMSFNPIIHHKIYPLEKNVTGDLENVLELVHKAHNLSYNSGEQFSHFTIQMTLKTLEIYTLNDSTQFQVTIILTDSDGKQSDFFIPTKLSNENLRSLEKGLKRTPGVNITIYEDIMQKKAMVAIPENLTNFKIHTEIIQK